VSNDPAVGPGGDPRTGPTGAGVGRRHPIGSVAVGGVGQLVLGNTPDEQIEYVSPLGAAERRSGTAKFEVPLPP